MSTRIGSFGRDYHIGLGYLDQGPFFKFKDTTSFFLNYCLKFVIINERNINGGQSNGILSDDWFDVAWSFRFEDRIFSPKGEKVYSIIYLDKLPWDSTSSLCNLVRIAKIRKEASVFTEVFKCKSLVVLKKYATLTL